jgi:hypothetical protein
MPPKRRAAGFEGRGRADRGSGGKEEKDLGIAGAAEDEREGAAMAVETDLAPGGGLGERLEGIRPGDEEEPLVGGEVRSMDAGPRGQAPGKRTEGVGASGRQGVGLAAGVRADAGSDGEAVVQEDGDAAGGAAAPGSGRKVEEEVEEAPVMGMAAGQMADLGFEVGVAADLRGGEGRRIGAEEGCDDGPLRLKETAAHGHPPTGRGRGGEEDASSSSGGVGMGRLARCPIGTARAVMIAS